MLLPDGNIDPPRAGHAIFSVLLFHLCHCLLNHPFLLHQKVDASGLRVPATWMKNSLRSGVEHARALSALVRDAETAGFVMPTSFHGYFLLVAGSIDALYSYSPDPKTQNECFDYFLFDLESLEELA